MTFGRWAFRAIEIDDGRWSCRRGRDEYDTHELLKEAIEHLSNLASEHRPSEVFTAPTSY
jgi:hypothetical protein